MSHGIIVLYKLKQGETTISATSLSDIFKSLQDTLPKTPNQATQSLPSFAELLDTLAASNPATPSSHRANHHRSHYPNHLNGEVKVRRLTEQELEAVRSATPSDHYSKPLRSYTLKRYQEPLLVKSTVARRLMERAVVRANMDSYPKQATTTDLYVAFSSLLTKHYNRVFSGATVKELVVTTLGEGRDYVAR